MNDHDREYLERDLLGGCYDAPLKLDRERMKELYPNDKVIYLHLRDRIENEIKSLGELLKLQLHLMNDVDVERDILQAKSAYIKYDDKLEELEAEQERVENEIEIGIIRLLSLESAFTDFEKWMFKTYWNDVPDWMKDNLFFPEYSKEEDTEKSEDTKEV